MSARAGSAYGGYRTAAQPPMADLVAERNQELRDAWGDEEINADDLDRTTRRALRKAGRL